MAVLGAQLVITLVAVSLMQKIGIHYSFARWLLCSTGLSRYLHPTNAELRELANIPVATKGKGRKGGGGGDRKGEKDETFHVPRSLDVELKSAAVSATDVVQLRYYLDYQWLVDFTMYAAAVYATTELYRAWLPYDDDDETNLSVLWLTLALCFSASTLWKLSVQYWRGGAASGGERSLCLTMGVGYAVLALSALLLLDGRVLDLGLGDAYSTLSGEAARYAGSAGGGGRAGELALRLAAAAWAGVHGALVTFPGLRWARSHRDAAVERVPRLALDLVACLPLALAALWVAPVARDYVTGRGLASVAAFESARLAACVAAGALHVALLPVYLRAYLALAERRIAAMRREAGRVLNTEVRAQVAGVYYYLCAAALQHVVPPLQIALLAAATKTLGGYEWWPGGATDEYVCGGAPDAAAEPPEPSLRTVFSPLVWRGLLNFATWWCCFAWFAATSIGHVYQSYFTHS